MTPAERAREMADILVITPERGATELAVRIAEICIGAKPKPGSTASEALAKMGGVDPDMERRFRLAGEFVHSLVLAAVNSAQKEFAERERSARISGAEEMRPKWQPIETAPKDGRFFQAWIPALHEQGFIGRIDAFWDAENKEFAAVRSDVLDDYEPTHWMPLPAPPVSLPLQSGKGEETPNG